MEGILRTSGLIFKDILSYPDLTIEKGAMTFIRGESGSGKSTLLKLFNATLAPTSGTIFYNGKDISGLDTIELRRKVLLAGQDTFLFRGSIYDNFDLFYEKRGQKSLDRKEIQKFLDICQSGFTPESDCNVMSGGERQRVYNAIALSFRPEVIMFDEPTSALDAVTAGSFMKNLKQYCISKGITIVAVSHDARLADSYGDRFILLRKGMS